jgi:exodeoxyribonuclease VII large subunit
MEQTLTLSELLYQVDEAIEAFFGGEIFWIKAEITDVKKYPSKRWCFVTLVEKDGEQIIGKAKANIWNTGYASVLKFEEATKQEFGNGLEIICAVTVKHHKVFGLSFEILNIDTTFAVGKIQEEKELTLEKLLRNHPKTIQLIEGQYYSYNQQILMPAVPQRIALLTAQNSDGLRDFVKELQENNYGYQFVVDAYYIGVQGDGASATIVEALQQVQTQIDKYDVLVMVRGGGSQLDFKPFNNYDVCALIANFALPILTGIGHDANVCIADLMARGFKTPTKVAHFIVDRCMQWEQSILQLQDKANRKAQDKLQQETNYLQQIKRILKASNPELLLQKGYAIVRDLDNVITSTNEVYDNQNLQIQLANGQIEVVVKNK